MTREDVLWMPTVNAALNAAAAVLLVVGRVRIARGDVAGHRRTMLAACAVSAAFLVSYLTYHAIAGSTRYPADAPLRPLYLAILLSHTVLAASLAWLVPRTVWLGLRDRRDAHRRIARWTFPIWLYVSVTGVVVWLMLYPFAPAGAGR
jgi:uncharacterized membrane protein YozB (DUF420 family)